MLRTTKLIYEFLSDSNYRIEEDGKVYTRISLQGHITNTWRIKKATTIKGGYKNIRYGRAGHLKLHRVMYAKFHGLLDESLVINHKDSNPSNNHFTNVEQVSQAVNNLQAYRVGGKSPVIGHFKLLPEQVVNMRNLYSKGVPAHKLCTQFNMSKSTVSLIVNNKIWKMVRQEGYDPTTFSLEN